MKSPHALIAALLLLTAGQAQAVDDPGTLTPGGNPDTTLSKETSMLLPMCASCHGLDGISTVEVYPNLAGQKADYLVKQLLAFKTRERTDPVMNPMAEPLSEEAIKELAHYFSTRR